MTGSGVTVKVDARVWKALNNALPDKVARFLDGEAESMVNGIKLSIQQVSPGRVYGSHTASAPGDPPNVDTGRLINSYTWERDGRYTRYIGSDVEYAHYLEFGTSKMDPRPHVGPEAERESARLPQRAVQFGLLR